MCLISVSGSTHLKWRLGGVCWDDTFAFIFLLFIRRLFFF